MQVSLWQLADTVEYGDNASKFILVSPNGEEEVSGVFATEDAAEAYVTSRGWTLVPLIRD